MQPFLTHWKTSLAGLLAGAFAAFAATKGLDTMSAAQAAGAFGSALLTAFVGLFASDGSKNPPQQ